MTCPVDSEQLESYLDKESEAKFSEWFETHRRECSLCRQRYELHKHLKSVVRQSVLSEVAPEPVRMRLLRALDEAAGGVKAPAEEAPVPVLAAVTPAVKARPRPQLNWFRPALAAAGILLVGTTAFMGIAHHQPHAYALGTAMETDHNRCFSRKAPTISLGARPVAADPVALCQADLGQSPQVAHFPALAQCDVRMCPLDGHKALHTMYNDPMNNTVSLYTLPESSGLGQNLPEATNTIEPAMFEAREHNLAAWKRNGWVYSLVANMPTTDLAHLAQQGSYTTQDAQAIFNPVPTGVAPPGQPIGSSGQSSSSTFGVPVEPVVYTQTR